MAQAITQDVIAHDKASKTYDNVGKSVDRLAKQTTQANRRIAEANKRTQQSNQDSIRSYGRLTTSTGKLRTSFGFAAKGIAVAGLGIATGLAFAATAGIKTAAAMEQAKVGFTTLLGSGKKAQTFLTTLQKFAAATPFTFPGLVVAARQLLGAGAAAKSVIPTLTAFGDAAGALGLSQDNFNHIMLATTQAMAAGKLQAGDLLQITEAGLPVWKLLSEAMHKPVAEIRKLSQQGKLLTSDVLPLLQKQMEKDYGGSMIKQSQTLAGIWSTLTDTLSIGLANALVPLLPMLKKLASGGIRVLTVAFQKVADAGKVFATKIVPAIQTAISAMTEGFRNGATSDGTTGFLGVFDKIGVLIRKLKDTFAPLVGDAVAIIVAAFQGLKNFFDNTFLPTALKVTDWMSNHKSLSRDVVKAILAVIVAYKLLNVAIATATTIQLIYNAAVATNPYVALILGTIAVVAAMVVLYKHVQLVRDVFDTLGRAIKVWAQANLAVFQGVITGIRLLVTAFLRLLLAPVLAVFGAILHGAALAFGWVPGLGGKLRTARDAFDKFKNEVNNIINSIDPLKPPKPPRLSTKEFAADVARYKALFNTITGLSGVNYVTTVFTNQGSPFDPRHRASGGPVIAGNTYQVNERGPEYFTPSVSGTITPHGRTPPGGGSDGGGSGITINEVHVHGVQTTSQLWQELQKYAKRNGSLRLSGVTAS